MTFVCSISHWEGVIALAPHPDDVAAVTALGPLELTVRGRCLTFRPSVDGNRSHPIDPDRNAGLQRETEWEGEFQFARFIRHVVEVSLLDDGSLQCELEPDHELPVPILREGRTGNFSPQEVAERDLRMRALSALRVGGEDLLKRTLRRIPDHFRAHLRGRWFDVLSKTVTDWKKENTHGCHA